MNTAHICFTLPDFVRTTNAAAQAFLHFGEWQKQLPKPFSILGNGKSNCPSDFPLWEMAKATAQAISHFGKWQTQLPERFPILENGYINDFPINTTVIQAKIIKFTPMITDL